MYILEQGSVVSNMNAQELKNIFEPLMDDLELLNPRKDSPNYYSGKYDLNEYTQYVPFINEAYLRGDITRHEFYEYINTLLKYRTKNHFTDVETVFARALDNQGWEYLVELENDELLSEKGNPLRMDFVIMSLNDDHKIVVFVECDGDGHGKSEEAQKNDERKNEYFSKLNVPFFRFNETEIMAFTRDCIERIRPYVEEKVENVGYMSMDPKFLNVIK